MEIVLFSRSITRFPYENSVISEGNSTILPMERKPAAPISPMRSSSANETATGLRPTADAPPIEFRYRVSRTASQSAIAPITAGATTNEGSFS
jgi:hypothetical protein